MTPDPEVSKISEEDELKKPLGASPEEFFWYWIQERHSIYLKKQAGEPKPWTIDPILQSFRFTNPFRYNDKVTAWVREHFISLSATHPDDLLAFNLVWFRWFNRIETAEALGFQEDFQPEEMKALLRERLKRGERVFTSAYIIRSDFGRPKIDSVVDALQPIWDARHELVGHIYNTKSLESVTRFLTRFHLIGDFMAYEMVSDMRYTRLLNDANDIYTWANPGPGAYRGLRRIFGEPKLRKSDGLPEQYLCKTKMVPLMQELLSRAETSLPIGFPRLEMRDIEHSLCEFDKYSRVKLLEGRPRQLYPGGQAS